MPTYHYACSTCSDEFDQYQSFTEDTLTVCPSCEGFIRRVIQPVGVVFKGTGWYLTDSRTPEKSENDAKSTKDGSADSSPDKAESKAAKSDKQKTEAAEKKPEPASAARAAKSKPAPIAAS